MKNKRGKVKIAFLGARGIPAKYGGYETFLDELIKRFKSKADIEITIYCRSNYYKDKNPSLYGARLIYIPSPRIKAIESLYHSFISSIHVLFLKNDLIYFVDPANAPFCILLRLFGKRIIVHTDGLGWKRRKWGRFARAYYRMCELICAKVANTLITDNVEMKKYYQMAYKTDSIYIPYGVSDDIEFNDSILSRYNLSYKKYFLIVARLEPENNTEFIIKDYIKTTIEFPLIIVGDSPYNSKYLKHLLKISDSRVKFIGRINDQTILNTIYKGAYLYLHGHEVGGTNPSLLRAMSVESAPVVINVPFNRAVIEDSGFVFEKKDGQLSSLLEVLIKNPDYVLKKSLEAKKHVEKYFRWEVVVEDHNKLFHRLMEQEEYEQ